MTGRKRAVTKSGTGTWDGDVGRGRGTGTWDSGLGVVGLGVVGLGVVGLGVVGLGVVGLGDTRGLGDVINNT